jgi:predicted PurR-regulated permease PerM
MTTAPGAESGWMTRERTLAFILVVFTALALYLCYLLAKPFFPALTWALALAVISYPLHRAIANRMKGRDVGALLSCAIVAVIVVAPALLVARQIGREAADAVQMVQEEAPGERWRSAIEKEPALAPVLIWIEERVDVKSEVEEVVKAVGARIPGVVTTSAWAAMQLLITFLVLFYFLRDRDQSLALVRSLSPLTERETARVFKRVSETIRGTVFGTLVVAVVQGVLGGAMFWLLGLPAPVLWGAVMAVLSIVPVLGTFLIWLPAAGFLALGGDWGKALILIIWGSVVVSLIDNLLYPVLVGSKLRLHTLPVFFAIVGGFIVFGGSGLILGPVVLAVTVALIEVWRQRTRGGHTVEKGAE